MSATPPVELVETAFRKVPLGEVLSIDRRSVAPGQISDGTLYVGLESIGLGGDIDESVTVQANELKSAKFAFDSRHVLYGKLRPNLGKVARPNRSGVCSTDIYPLVPGAHLDRGYLAHYLLTPEVIARAASRTTGVNLPRISSSVLESFEIPLPPLPEQRRIAAILDRVCELRAKRQHAVALLEDLIGAVFADSFGQPRRKGQSGCFGDVIVGAQNGLYVPSAGYGSGVPILRIADFDSGASLALHGLKRVNISAADRVRFGLAPGDLVINRVNAMSHVGKSAIIVSCEEPTVFESNMMRIKVDQSRVLPEFVLAWLQTNATRAGIRRSAKQAINQASVNQQDISALRMDLPTLEQQHAFVTRVVAIRNTTTVQLRHLSKLVELFASLQHRAFRGEL